MFLPPGGHMTSQRLNLLTTNLLIIIRSSSVIVSLQTSSRYFPDAPPSGGGLLAYFSSQSDPGLDDPDVRSWGKNKPSKLCPLCSLEHKYP